MLEPCINQDTLRAILGVRGIDGPVSSRCVHHRNHVYAIHAGGRRLFLKVHTKPWYPSDPAAPVRCVEHESAAYRCLHEYGLPSVPIVHAETNCDNPIGWQYLLMEALPGRSLTDLDATALPAALRAVGEYLGRMHMIVFERPGYIYRDGPSKPDRDDAWQHPIWTLDALNKARPRDNAETEAFVHSQLPVLREAYATPRFTHGDCHAHQFFLQPVHEQWQVTGVVDLEVASAGDCGWDLVKFMIEAAVRWSPESRWWMSFLDGYGHEMSFSSVKARFLACGQENYTWLRGSRNWPSEREALGYHILNAQNWEQLFVL